MRMLEALKLSWVNVRGHKLRSLLATLGVMIGIGAVIAIVTMSAGFQSSLLGVITQDLLHADTISVSLKGSVGFFGGDRVFSERDVERIKALDGVKSADVGGRLRGGALYAGGKRILAAKIVASTSPDIVPITTGRTVEGPKEIVLGAKIAKKVLRQLGLIPDLSPEREEALKRSGKAEAVDYSKVLGQTVRMRYLNRDHKADEALLTVVGAVKESQFLDSDSCYVTIDYHSDVETLDGKDYLVFPGLFVRVADVAQLEAVRNAVQAYLESDASDVRRLVGSQLKLDIQTTKEVVDEINANLTGVTAFLGGIGGVALFVGMIGVMNIMLVSVKERTREIGVMKATGATNAAVLKLFLTESTLICSLGALLGVGLGMAGSRLISAALIALSPGLDDIPFVLTPGWYAIAVITGLVVGIFSGVYPALSAARTDPIQALRYE